MISGVPPTRMLKSWRKHLPIAMRITSFPMEVVSLSEVLSDVLLEDENEFDVPVEVEVPV